MNEFYMNLETSLKDVPPSNILNFDETNLSDDPGSKKCIFKRGTKHHERVIKLPVEEPSPASIDTVIIPEADEDPYDADHTVTDFFRELRTVTTYWIKIRVTFYTSRGSFYHLCQSCCDRFLFCCDTYVYYNFVSYHRDCFRFIFVLFAVISCIL
ncbi:hypothetical protein PYW08_006054 [Mythimna loreyi]|uniref:Uncharacterized protein n=1 Tax=Mythimna loreyi TaxID=667449 RepID=A0ACC2QNG9_9NEOP|nr:hypothetical protein PYW08_006054 [Mythimna loreyi]